MHSSQLSSLPPPPVPELVVGIKSYTPVLTSIEHPVYRSRPGQCLHYVRLILVLPFHLPVHLLVHLLPFVVRFLFPSGTCSSSIGPGLRPATSIFLPGASSCPLSPVPLLLSTLSHLLLFLSSHHLLLPFLQFLLTFPVFYHFSHSASLTQSLSPHSSGEHSTVLRPLRPSTILQPSCALLRLPSSTVLRLYR